MLAVLIASGDRSGASVRLTGLPVLWWLLAGVAYYGISELLTGTSPGKAVMGLCVRQLDTSEPTSKQIVVRTCWRVVDVFGGYLLGLIVALTSPKRQRIGDRVAKTVVLQRADVTKESFPARWSMILAGVVVATFVGSGFLYAQSLEAETRLGAFDIETEVVPFTELVIEDGLRPATLDGMRTHALAELFPEADLERLMEYMSTEVGELTEEYERNDTEKAELRLGRGTEDVVNVLYEAKFEKGPGHFLISVADVDGELKMIGFRFWV